MSCREGRTATKSLWLTIIAHYTLGGILGAGGFRWDVFVLCLWTVQSVRRQQGRPRLAVGRGPRRRHPQPLFPAERHVPPLRPRRADGHAAGGFGGAILVSSLKGGRHAEDPGSGAGPGTLGNRLGGEGLRRAEE